MILANHPCPNCKSILECEGVAEGELVDCPQCGKPFEVPFLKRLAKPTPLVVPVQKSIIDPSKRKRFIFSAFAILVLFVWCSSIMSTTKSSQQNATQAEAPVDVANCRRLTGNVTQITSEGLMLSRAKISYKSLDSSEMYNAGPEFEPVFVRGASASVDGESWDGVVVDGGVFSYTTVLGASKRINAYREVKNYR